MAGPRCSVRLESIGQPIKLAIETAARLGFLAVEFDAVGELAPDRLSSTGRRQLLHLVRSREMNLSGVGFPNHRGFHVQENLEARVSAAKKTLALAADMRAAVALTHLGVVPGEKGDSTSSHFHEALLAIGREGERIGVRLAVPCDPLPPEELVKLIADLGTAGIGVDFHPAHLPPKGIPMADGVRALAGHIAAVHCKDLARSATSIIGFRESPIGKGEIDWRLVLAGLAEADYHGYLTLGGAADRPLSELEEGMRFLRSL